MDLRSLPGLPAAFLALLSALALATAPAAAQTEPAPAQAVRVQILGELAKPGNYTLAAGSRLSDALRVAGVRVPSDPPAAGTTLADYGAATGGSCVSGSPNLRMVFLTRTTAGHRASYSFDALRGTTDGRADPVLLDGDKLYVPACRGLSPFKQIAVLPVRWRKRVPSD